MSDHESDLTQLSDPLARARAWTRVLDERFRLFGFRFGLDGILGLVPVAGDAITVIGGLVMLASAQQLGLPAWTKAKIVGFTVLDFLVGSIPVLGDLFDFAYKSHTYSLRAIEKAHAKRADGAIPRERRADRAARRR